MDVTTITTPFMLNISVNCYLIRGSDGFVLIDTGMPNRRKGILQRLEAAGCQPGDLKLIILTHGDMDHSGNAAYFRELYGAPIALHPADAGMVERGDMFANRTPPNAIMRTLFGLIFGLRPANRFSPDLLLEDGMDFEAYGLAATAVNLPGHSLGNTAVLTANGDLFCGDLLSNTGKPELWSIIDDRAAASTSVERVKTLPVRTVYPGHGRSFDLSELAD